METIKYTKLLGTQDSQYIKVYLENPMDTQKFMGHGKYNLEGFVQVENNYINQILLGIWEPITEGPSPVYTSSLKDFQVKDVAHMLRRPTLLNRNPMGLGKTIETIVLLREMNVKNAIIICPKPVIGQWVNAIEIWASALKDKIVTKVTDMAEDKILVTNYEQVVIDRYQPLLKSHRWEFIVVDEAHRIKNRRSKRTKAIRDLPAQHRLALTGTPILKHVDDLWSILRFLNWKYSGASYWNFVYYFCKVTDSFWGKDITGITDDSYRLEALNMLLDDISIYNPIEVAQGINIAEVSLIMDTKQKKLYDTARKLLLDELPKDCTIPNGAVLTVRLRQITSCPKILTPDDNGFVGIKFEWIKDYLEDNPETKICVFTKFAAAATLLLDYLNSKNKIATAVTGKYKVEDREANKFEFLNNPNIRCFIGTIDCVGQGYDGLQDVCNVGIFLDRDWSPEINRQVEDRLHRMGQKKPVFIYYLTCAKSFDTHVGKINEHKANDIRKALMEDD